MIEKQCKGCLKVKPLVAFYKRDDTLDGRTGKCKPCLRLASNQRRAANPEKYRELERMYREHNKYGRYKPAFDRVRERLGV